MNRSWILLPVALLAACSSGSGHSPFRPAPSPFTEHTVSLDHLDSPEPTLSVESGATSVSVTTADLHGSAVRVDTPLGSGQVPTLAATHDGTVHLTLASAPGGGGNGPLDIIISAALPWSISLDGGETDVHVDARSGHVRSVDLPAGASKVQLDLPAPDGTQGVRESGGVSDLTITTASGTPVNVHETGGLSTLMIDSATHSGLGGNQTFTDPGYASASKRLDVELVAGVSSATVSHRP